jgi:asparagine synthase (glutamine-hydrolysing)
MPGICGLVGQTAPENLDALLAEMLGRLRHHDWYRTDRHVDATAGLALGRASLGFVNRGPQPAFSPDGWRLAVMEGEVHDYDEHRRALEAAGCRFVGTGHAELLLHGYHTRDRDFFRGLHGAFAAAIWDRRRQLLILVNDRFGLKPLYYVRLPGRLLFASAVRPVLADPEVPRGSNLRGIAQFFAFGQLLGEDTLLDAVRLLPAAGWLTYDVNDGKASLSRYWQLRPAPLANLKEADALDQIDAAFGRAVERRLGGTDQLGLSLSGGLDARTILAAIDTKQVPLTAVSIGMDGSLDHRSAARLAALAGCHHQAYVLNEKFLARFEQHLRHMVHLTDGHYLSQCIVMPTLPFYRELGIEVLLRGHAGEWLHMDKAYNFSLDHEALALRTEEQLEEWLLGHLRTYLLEAVDGPLFAARHQGHMEELARDSLHACLAESRGIEPAPHRIWHLFLSQRVRRETAQSLVKFGSLVETRLPYVDADLLELLLGVPPAWKVGDRIQAHILRRRRPAFLGVVNSNTGAGVGAGPLRRKLGWLRMKVLARLGVRGYQPYERLGRWLREELRPVVEHLLLRPGCLDGGIFNPQTVRTVVAQHLDGQRNHTFLLMALMIFEQGRRHLAEGDRAADELLAVRS